MGRFINWIETLTTKQKVSLFFTITISYVLLIIMTYLLWHCIHLLFFTPSELRKSSVQITLYIPELDEIETVIVREFQDPIIRRCGYEG